MFERRLLRHMDFTLLLVTLALAAFGLVTLFSASGGGIWFARQVVFLALGLFGIVAMMYFDFQRLQNYQRWLYGFNLLLLVLVLIVGVKVKGAQRWISLGDFRLQPSEFAKLACIITLSIFVINQKERVTELSFLLRSLLHIGIPALLVFLQPDLGTSLVLAALWFGILYFAGARLKHLLGFALAGVLLFGLAWKVGIIKDYQKQRLYAFIDPYSDPEGSGYHILQSQIAIGSGGLWGKGFLKGKMAKLKFVPEQQTDFIFTTVGREFGFAGAAGVLVLFFLFFRRMLFIMRATESELGMLLVGGVLVMFAVHVLINIGMTIRLMPITGLPLPFFSYGGSNLLTCCLAVGLVQSVAMRRQKLIF